MTFKKCLITAFVFFLFIYFSYQSDVHTHDCGLQIKDPVIKDLGLWRCAVETEEETYYGFLRVLCPWVMRDPEVAATIVMRTSYFVTFYLKDLYKSLYLNILSTTNTKLFICFVCDLFLEKHPKYLPI